MGDTRKEAATDDAAILKPKIKHDWYQTETHVILTILAKNIDPNTVDIEYKTKSVHFKTEDHELSINLWGEINHSGCSYKVTPSKVEVKLAKRVGIRWEKLDETPKPVIPKVVNWDRIAKDFVEDEPQGEAALNQLFQKIYGESNEDVQRAMNKSFQESGGTVLSTNWNDVSKEKVTVRPPDGMEFKKWDE